MAAVIVRTSMVKILSFIAMTMVIMYSSPIYGIKNDLDFHTINMRNGLSHNMVKALLKDSKGFVWIGTHNGLDRFDGTDIVTYSQLVNRSIFTLCEIDSIYLWIGTDKGLMRLNRKMETCEEIVLENKSLAVKSLCPLGKSGMLVATVQGLFIIQGEKIEKVYFNSNVLSQTNSLSEIIKGSSPDIYWIASNYGLVKFNIRTRDFRTYVYPSTEQDMNSFICMTLLDDNIYIGTKSRGMVVFNSLRNEFSLFPDIGNAYITTLSPAGEQMLYVGTDGGGVKVVSTSTGKVVSTISHSSAKGDISSNAIYSFLYDGKVYWIGTFLGGLNYTPARGDLFSIYNSPSLFNSKDYNIRSFHLRESGDKVIGTRDGLFYISEQKKEVKHFSSASSILRSDIILAIYPSGDDYLIGTLEGLYRLNVSSLTLSYFDNKECFKKNIFSTIVGDGNGTIWLGSSSGLFVYDLPTGDYKFYDHMNSVISNPSIHTIMLDSKNRAWISNVNSVYIYDISTQRFIPESFPSDVQVDLKDVRFIYEDRYHSIWLCTDKEGVIRINEHFTKFEKMHIGDFFEDNLVVGMVEDQNGLWISSQRGLICYNIETGDYKLFSLYDGIPGYIFNYSVQKMNDGSLWWGNESGLVSYNSNEHINKSTADILAPVITSISVSGRVLRAGDPLMESASDFVEQIQLPSFKNNIGFSFSSMNYSLENTDIYEYSLEGNDDGWNKLTHGNSVFYENLPIGNYTFKVRSSFNPEKETRVKVCVVRSVSYWVYICLVSLLLCSVLLFFYSRLLAKYRSVKDVKQENNISKEKYISSKMEDEKVEYIKKHLLEYMNEKKPYLNSELKRQDVALGVNCAPDELSQVLNLYLNTNFTDFINQYRVEEFIIRVKDSSSSKYTLVSLAEQCGFNSRSSFFRSFKKIKEKTPLEYMKEHNIDLK
ncbi:two-component regulator propeller domain-containing protein [Bacteroides intestinalis]|nr:two-component regulator propeller domain-containing protein [Bacteroides intestinalis]